MLVFQSTREELLGHQTEVPFAVVPDPAKAMSREFAAEQSWRAVFNPRAWLPGNARLDPKGRRALADKSGGIRGFPSS